MTQSLSEHGETFLRGVNKRHRPPFLIEPSPRAGERSRWRLVDGQGYVVRRFSRWRFAYLALVAMCARVEVEAPIEVVARRYTREAQWALVRKREAARHRDLLRKQLRRKRS